MPPLNATSRSVALLPLVCTTALLAGCNLVVLAPSGDVAAQQGRLVVQSTLLMLLIIIPVIALTLLFAWRYRQSSRTARYEPDWDHSIQLELVIWAAPLLIIIALGALTWISTHTLDPYRSLRRIDAQRFLPRDTAPLVVQAVALDWKWLFIYPEQGIAVVNELAAPVDRAIRFQITSNSVMNAFYVPALAGMIYAMPGMETSLHAVINKAGVYEGFSANYSGAGFSDMRFKFHALDNAGFERWIESARAAGNTGLNRAAYIDLRLPTERDPVRRFNGVAPDLWGAILNRCVEAGAKCLHQQMAEDARRQFAAARPKQSLVANAVCTISDPLGVGPVSARARD
jgi:cytochrome o ubiquinol oxidase subunit II